MILNCELTSANTPISKSSAWRISILFRLHHRRRATATLRTEPEHDDFASVLELREGEPMPHSASHADDFVSHCDRPAPILARPCVSASRCDLDAGPTSETPELRERTYDLPGPRGEPADDAHGHKALNIDRIVHHPLAPAIRFRIVASHISTPRRGRLKRGMQVLPTTRGRLPRFASH
jgi:hypothetical protein